MTTRTNQPMVRAPQIPVEPTLIAGTLGNDSCAPVTRKSLMEIPILVVQTVFMIIIAIQGRFFYASVFVEVNH